MTTKPPVNEVQIARTALNTMLPGPAFEMVAAGVEHAAVVHELPSPKTFMLAGKAIFTLQGARSRYTYKVTKKEATDRFPHDAFFVHVLTGQDNENDYTYVGKLNPYTGLVTPTAKSTYKDDSPIVAGFNWTTKRVWANMSLGPVKIFHAGHCGRCGRLLTVPTSIETGFGPECAGKVGL